MNALYCQHKHYINLYFNTGMVDKAQVRSTTQITVSFPVSHIMSQPLPTADVFNCDRNYTLSKKKEHLFLFLLELYQISTNFNKFG